MAVFGERISQVEVKVDTFRNDVAELKDMIAGLETRMERRFDAVDRRFEAVDRRFDSIDRRFEAVDRRFNWVIGVQFTTLFAILAAMAGVLTRLF